MTWAETKEVMATIKALVVENQRQKGGSTDDDTVRAKLAFHLNDVCRLLPNDTPEGREFASLMFEVDKKRVDKWIGMVFDKLLERALKESDDLKDLPFLRQRLIDKIQGKGVK